MSSLKGVWRKVIANGRVPKPRSSHCLTVIGQKAFLFGGEHSPRVPIDNNIELLDISSRTWKTINATGDIPASRNATSMAAVGEKIYMFGGRTGIGIGEGSLCDLYCFDTTDCRWSVVPVNGSVPTSRSYHTMAAVENSLYVFGGCGEKARLNDLHKFDLSTNTWEEMPSSDDIVGRGGSGLVSVESSLYVVGGFCGTELDDTHCFDIRNKTWTKLSPKSNFSGRSVFGITSLDSHIFVFGGEIKPSDGSHETAGTYTNDCFVMDVTTNEGWSKVSIIGDSPSPRAWLPAAGMESRSVIIFGGTNSKNERLDDTYVLELSKQ